MCFGVFQKCQMCGIFPYAAFAFAALYIYIRSGHSYTPLTHPRAPQTLHPCSLTPFPDIPGQFRITTDTNRHQTTPTNVLRGCVAVHVDIEWSLLESVGV